MPAERVREVKLELIESIESAGQVAKGILHAELLLASGEQSNVGLRHVVHDEMLLRTTRRGHPRYQFCVHRAASGLTGASFGEADRQTQLAKQQSLSALLSTGAASTEAATDLYRQPPAVSTLSQAHAKKPAPPACGKSPHKLGTASWAIAVRTAMKRLLSALRWPSLVQLSRPALYPPMHRRAATLVYRRTCSSRSAAAASAALQSPVQPLCEPSAYLTARSFTKCDGSHGEHMTPLSAGDMKDTLHQIHNRSHVPGNGNRHTAKLGRPCSRQPHLLTASAVRCHESHGADHRLHQPAAAIGCF